MMLATIESALDDIHSGLRMRRVWIALAQEDIGDQHRRTALGPLWLLINYFAFAGTFIFVIHRGDTSTGSYAAYVATGLLVWFYIMETLSQSVSLFVREEGFIKGTTLPLSVYVMRLLMQSAIRAAYALVGCIVILLLSGTALSTAWLWSALGVLLILATTPAAIILFAFLGAYFPDSQFIVSNIMRIGMFLTPVFWSYEGSGGVRHLLYYWNPFTYFLEIVRVPILTGGPPIDSLLLCGAIGLVLWTAALMVLGLFRKRVVFVI
ncbi:ABC transporter permease [Chelativorans xinjiangense]|uniref:ABC transporter permease n=1 Tax=Chelativorans xinjiangense TaxID=2681485 RepID=UPI001FE3A832|nr:ABC transporter permease [Chelativorans xinjiangense]